MLSFTKNTINKIYNNKEVINYVLFFITIYFIEKIIKTKGKFIFEGRGFVHRVGMCH